MSSDETCPCCGQEPTPGLFERPVIVRLPLAIAELRAAGELAGGEILDELPPDDPQIITVDDRVFLRAWAQLPFSRTVRALTYGLWVELTPAQAERIRAARDAGRRASLHAPLACTWPGFPGSTGARARVQLEADGDARIDHVADDRIMAAGQDPISRHRDLARLYRIGFGGPGHVAQAGFRGFHLRGECFDALEGFAGRNGYREQVPVPVHLTGLELPAERAVFPPRDTGGEAILATLGNAEACRPGRRVELVALLRDPTEPLVEAFSMLTYWGRYAKEPLDVGRMLRMPAGIEGAESMRAWLLCEPPMWLVERWPQAELHGEQVRFLYAVPITEDEMNTLHRYGAKQLLAELETVEDLRDPHRGDS